MKRRDFLKGITAIGAISAAPKLISSEAERQLSDAKILHNGPVRGGLPEGYQIDRTLTDNESWFLSTPPDPRYSVTVAEIREEAARILELDNHLYTIGEQTIELDYSGPESPFDRIVEYTDNKELTMKLWK